MLGVVVILLISVIFVSLGLYLIVEGVGYARKSKRPWLTSGKSELRFTSAILIFAGVFVIAIVTYVIIGLF